MPFKPKRTCAYISCSNRAPAGQAFCRMHQREQNKRYEEERGTSAERGYGSSRWRRLRKLFLARNPFCAECGEIATEIDHIIPHRGDMSLFWDEDNFQSMCHTCHSRKTAAEDGGFGNYRYDEQFNEID